MSRVITFSQTFPAYHPKAGQPTNFVEQIWNGLNYLKLPVPKVKELPNDFMWSILPLSNYGTKFHTIRSGNRWKVGDKFSPRVWSGKPYKSKQITIAPDIEVKKVWPFEIKQVGFNGEIFITHSFPELELYNLKERVINPGWIEEIAENDGLSLEEFMQWFQFPKPFHGQIISWSSDIVY